MKTAASDPRGLTTSLISFTNTARTSEASIHIWMLTNVTMDWAVSHEGAQL